MRTGIMPHLPPERIERKIPQTSSRAARRKQRNGSETEGKDGSAASIPLTQRQNRNGKRNKPDATTRIWAHRATTNQP